MKKLLSLILLLTSCAALRAQNKEIRRGNKAYAKEEFSQAEQNYRHALTEDSSSFKAAFNLGDALYTQKRYEEAAQQFGHAAQMAGDKNDKAKAYHNLGNTYLKAN